MADSVYTQSFQHAAAKLGGTVELAVCFQVSVENVEHWLRGTMRPPVGAFLRVVDLIMPEDPPEPYGRLSRVR
jgi:hypothetical protein